MNGLFFFNLLFQWRIKITEPIVEPYYMNKFMGGYIQHEWNQFDKRMGSLNSIENPVILQADSEKLEFVRAAYIPILMTVVPAKMGKCRIINFMFFKVYQSLDLIPVSLERLVAQTEIRRGQLFGMIKRPVCQDYL